MHSLNEALVRWSPQMRSVLRLLVGLLFLQHGLVKFFGFPIAPPNPVVMGSMIWFQALIETVGGALLAVGLLTRSVAFILAGDMAVAYFMSHAPKSFYPIQNNGNLAVLYCFVFLYLMFSGPGPWSLDAKLGKDS